MAGEDTMNRAATRTQHSGPVGIERLIYAIMTPLAWAAFTLAPPMLRIALAVPFFKSGLTKWHGFLTLAPSAPYLFENEFKLHILGVVYAFPAPVVAAYVDAIAEIVLPILLVIGLATRFSALALLIMIGVIQLVVPEGWANFHLPWAAMAIALMALGAGPLSLDALIAQLFARGRPSR